MMMAIGAAIVVVVASYLLIVIIIVNIGGCKTKADEGRVPRPEAVRCARQAAPGRCRYAPSAAGDEEAGPAAPLGPDRDVHGRLAPLHHLPRGAVDGEDRDGVRPLREGQG
ncbi:hypothetical protein MN608_01042 [Microdochium nivale]|nr:hypothetical protein MN608_01042 [Microdochium nivale]